LSLQQLTSRAFLVSALYHAGGSFSHLPSFLRALDLPELDRATFSLTSTSDIVRDRLAADTSKPNGPVNRESVLTLVINQDLRRAVRVMSDPQVARSIDARADPVASLMQSRAAAIQFLAGIGVDASAVAVHIVDSLPEPYDNRPYSVLTVDEGDQAAFGIEPGLYFLACDLKPFYSDFLLCHEMVHAIVGTRSPELIARGLEEGIAELIGLYLSCGLFGLGLTRNLFIFNRLSTDYDLFWEQYLDAARQSLALYFRFGLEGLASILNGGRELLKTVEDAVLSDHIDDLDIPFGKGPEDFSRLSTSLLLLYPRASVVSPLAFYVAPFVRPGFSAREIAASAALSVPDCVDALDELRDQTSLLTLRRDKTSVLWTDAPRRHSVLRYAVGGSSPLRSSDGGL
jgi:hypothetical protein